MRIIRHGLTQIDTVIKIERGNFINMEIREIEL
jgi:hypothetical protein